jgi:hypothetical protein
MEVFSLMYSSKHFVLVFVNDLHYSPISVTTFRLFVFHLSPFRAVHINDKNVKEHLEMYMMPDKHWQNHVHVSKTKDQLILKNKVFTQIIFLDN